MYDKIFRHNDVNDLERILRESLLKKDKWRKVMIVVEGIYSLEGTIARLPEIVDLKKKYKAYLYLDEVICTFSSFSSTPAEFLYFAGALCWSHGIERQRYCRLFRVRLIGLNR